MNLAMMSVGKLMMSMLVLTMSTFLVLRAPDALVDTMVPVTTARIAIDLFIPSSKKLITECFGHIYYFGH